MIIQVEPAVSYTHLITDVLSCGLSVLFVMGFVLMGTAAVFAHKRWQKNGTRVEGEIVGYIEKKERGEQTYYFPVYRYTDATGTQHEKTSLLGFGSILQNKIGQKIPLIIHPDNPDDIQEANNKIALYVGYILIGSGVLGIFRMPLVGADGMLTLFMLAPAAFYISRRVRAYAAGERHFLETYIRSALKKSTSTAPLANEKSRTLDIPTAMETERKSSALSGMIAILLSAILFYAGYFFYTDVRHLTENGLHTEATVTSLESSSNSKRSSSLHPVLTFQDMNGKTFTFHSGYGGNLFDYKVGDKTQILYLAENPQGSAEIDLGPLNWIIPIALWIFAILCLSGGLSNLSKLTRPKTL